MKPTKENIDQAMAFLKEAMAPAEVELADTFDLDTLLDGEDIFIVDKGQFVILMA